MSLQPYTTLQILPVLFRACHTDCLILDTPSWHVWGNLLGAPLSSGPDMDNFPWTLTAGMDVITGVAYTPVSSALNFHSADGSQRTANRLVLHPTPEGPFHERSFSCTMQIYTALHFMAQPVFPIYELEIFPVVVPIRAWSKLITGKVVFHYLDSVAARSDFILQVLRPPWVPLWLRIM